MSDPLQKFDLAKARLSFASAILHTCDLDGLARTHEQLTSPQALIAGLQPSEQQNADYWLALINTARKLRDMTPLDPAVLDAVEDRLPPELQAGGAG